MGPQSGMLCGFVRPNDSRDDFAGNEIHTIFFQEERKARAASEKTGAQKRAETLRRAGNSRSIPEEMRQTHCRCRRVQDIS